MTGRVALQQQHRPQMPHLRRRRRERESAGPLVSAMMGGATYSTHKCAGVDMNFHEAWSSNKYATTISHEGGRRALQDGTCLFENVCSLDGILTYVQVLSLLALLIKKYKY